MSPACFLKRSHAKVIPTPPPPQKLSPPPHPPPSPRPLLMQRKASQRSPWGFMRSSGLWIYPVTRSTKQISFFQTEFCMSSWHSVLGSTDLLLSSGATSWPPPHIWATSHSTAVKWGHLPQHCCQVGPPPIALLSSGATSWPPPHIWATSHSTAVKWGHLPQHCCHNPRLKLPAPHAPWGWAGHTQIRTEIQNQATQSEETISLSSWRSSIINQKSQQTATPWSRQHYNSIILR